MIFRIQAQISYIILRYLPCTARQKPPGRYSTYLGLAPRKDCGIKYANMLGDMTFNLNFLLELRSSFITNTSMCRVGDVFASNIVIERM